MAAIHFKAYNLLHDLYGFILGNRFLLAYSRPERLPTMDIHLHRSRWYS
jgi:hypothetical protein